MRLRSNTNYNKFRLVKELSVKVVPGHGDGGPTTYVQDVRALLTFLQLQLHEMNEAVKKVKENLQILREEGDENFHHFRHLIDSLDWDSFTENRRKKHDVTIAALIMRANRVEMKRKAQTRRVSRLPAATMNGYFGSPLCSLFSSTSYAVSTDDGGDHVVGEDNGMYISGQDVNRDHVSAAATFAEEKATECERKLEEILNSLRLMKESASSVKNSHLDADVASKAFLASQKKVHIALTKLSSDFRVLNQPALIMNYKRVNSIRLDAAYRAVFGCNCDTFWYLKDKISDHLGPPDSEWVYPYEAILGVTLIYLRTGCPQANLQLLIGASQTTISRRLRRFIDVIVDVLSDDDSAKIAMPPIEVLLRDCRVAAAMYPELKHLDICCLMDGSLVPMESPPTNTPEGRLKQNIFYNGSKGRTVTNNLFLFDIFGRIIKSRLNCAGSVNDISLFQEWDFNIRGELRVFDNDGGARCLKVLSDAIFLTDSTQDIVVAPNRHNGPTEHVATVQNAVIDFRQSVEWDIGAWKEKFGVLKLPLPADDQKRGKILLATCLLHNLILSKESRGQAFTVSNRTREIQNEHPDMSFDMAIRLSQYESDSAFFNDLLADENVAIDDEEATLLRRGVDRVLQTVFLGNDDIALE